MSAGSVHTLSAVALATGFTVASLSVLDPDAMQYAAGAVVGIFVSPDCDVDKGFIAYHYIRRRLGDWAEWVWDRIWFMYRRSVKHGSELSHFPVVGTLGRLVYLFFFVLVVPYLFLDIFFPFNLDFEFRWWITRILSYWRVVVGMMGVDFIHFILDIATVDGKFDINSLLSLSPVPKRRRTA